MSRRLLSLLLVSAALAAPAFARDPGELASREARQRERLASYGRDVQIVMNEEGMPEQIIGALAHREAFDAVEAADRALRTHGAAFRRGLDDSFSFRTKEDDQLGQSHVRMTQTFRGIPVLGGELTVHLTASQTVGITGRFVPNLDDLDVVPAIDQDRAVAEALAFIHREGGRDTSTIEIGQPVIYALGGRAPRLSIPVTVLFTADREPHLDEVHVDAVRGSVLGVLPKMHTAKNRKIYNLNQTCVSTGSELPGTLLFQEGGTSSDSAAMGAYNGTGKTYDFYKAVFNRDSYDNAGATMTSSVHGQFSTGFFGCTKNNAAWIDSPYNQMVFGDGDGTTLGNLALSLDVTAHELTHAVTSRTANLAYQNDSGALNEGTSDILGEATSFWSNQGDWLIGADVYTPNTPGDALRYMNDPARDNQSADYYPTRNYASGCTPSSNNDYCGVHTNSGIANLAFYLMSQGGTHPRGKTSVAVSGIGITNAQQIWYRALIAYMNSSTTFQGARTATAQAAADLYGGTCSSQWQSVQKAWDAVGVPGTWSCSGPTTYSISGNAGTSGATITAGSASATSDGAGAYSLGNLAAGTYTVTPSKSGCTFSPASASVTVGPNATGINFTATCSGPTTYSISGNAGTSGATVTAGSSSTISDSAGAFAFSGLSAGTYTVTPSKSGCTFSPANRSVTVGPNATGINFTATCTTASQLLKNPGFESGNVDWTATAGVIDNSTLRPSRTGSWKAWLNGVGFLSTDTLQQTITIPASATTVTLSFWLRIDSSETTATYPYDTMKVQIRNTSGTVLRTLATYSNLNKNNTYVQKSFDITSYKGQTVQIYFVGTEDFSNQTSFVIDDTSVTVQ